MNGYGVSFTSFWASRQAAAERDRDAHMSDYEKHVSYKIVLFQAKLSGSDRDEILPPSRRIEQL
jgi:hypothetical protein